jgi:hypothetical protein
MVGPYALVHNVSVGLWSHIKQIFGSPKFRLELLDTWAKRFCFHCSCETRPCPHRPPLLASLRVHPVWWGMCFQVWYVGGCVATRLWNCVLRAPPCCSGVCSDTIVRHVRSSCTGVSQSSSYLETVTTCRGCPKFLCRVGGCRQADLVVFIDVVDWRWCFWCSSCTGLDPGWHATTICAPSSAADAFFGSQSFVVMVWQQLFGRRVLCPHPSAAALVAMKDGGKRSLRSAIDPPTACVIFFLMGCFLLLCWNSCSLWCLLVDSACAGMWILKWITHGYLLKKSSVGSLG